MEWRKDKSIKQTFLFFRRSATLDFN